MDKRIRRNELCVIGLPRCDFVFSSTRTCFIAYGFSESALEKDVLQTLLRERGIEPIEAGGSLAPAQNAFCAKICSKIITSQFCIALLNNDKVDGVEKPNANVNMEYGLMLGFNKFVIPFKREAESLPFNQAPLDTIKYTPQNFKEKAAKAIDQAIKESAQETASTNLELTDQVFEAFLISQRLLFVALNTEGDKNLYELGRALGFNLLASFDGLKYHYVGRFSAIRPEGVLWRLRTLQQIITERLNSIPERIAMGVAMFTPPQEAAIRKLFDQLGLMVLVTSAEDRKAIEKALSDKPLRWSVSVFTLDDMKAALQPMA